MDYKEYCGFHYGYDKEEGYSIIPNRKTEQPSTFYKYYALTDYNVEALTNMYVYATHPYQFNDLFDCNKSLIVFDKWDDVHNLYQDKYDELLNVFPTLEAACKESQKAYWNILYRKMGLVSLATRCDNYQMWALYAQNNGLCIEYDVDKFPFSHSGPFPINYVDKIPGAVHIGKDGGYIAMLIQSNVKNKWWQYENEWRLYIPAPKGFDLQFMGNEFEMRNYNLGNEHNRKFRYTADALKSIILGPKFFGELFPTVVSSSEIDIVGTSNKDSLKLRVIDFLAKIMEKTPLSVKWANLSDFDHYIFKPIQVIKYSDREYRIINN